MRTPGWCENIRWVLRRRWSCRPRHAAATLSARSMTSGSPPARLISDAAATPAGPAPTTTTSSSTMPGRDSAQSDATSVLLQVGRREQGERPGREHVLVEAELHDAGVEANAGRRLPP